MKPKAVENAFVLVACHKNGPNMESTRSLKIWKMYLVWNILQREIKKTEPELKQKSDGILFVFVAFYET